MFFEEVERFFFLHFCITQILLPRRAARKIGTVKYVIGAHPASSVADLAAKTNGPPTARCDQMSELCRGLLLAARGHRNLSIAEDLRLPAYRLTGLPAYRLPPRRNAANPVSSRPSKLAIRAPRPDVGTGTDGGISCSPTP